jgi:hypothetical protein
MFKRIVLTLTFVAAFNTIGIGLSNQAQAWRGGYYGYGRPYAAYYAPRAYYYGPTVVPYRAYYAPRVVRPYYPVYYGAPAYPVYYDGYYAAPAGVSVSVGY